MQSSILPSGGTTVYAYDSRCRVASISRGPSASNLLERIDYTYDASTGQKNLEKMSAYESGAWVEKRRESYAYDSRGRLALVTHADATSVAYTYDGANNIRSVRDERHTTPNTTYTYDPAGRLAAVTQTLSTAPGGHIVTAYGYDIHGNLTSVTDPNGNVTSYLYDDFGRMISQTSPVTGTTSYSYDPAGNLITSTDARAVTTTRTYDVLNRVTAATAAGSTTEATNWSYDGSAPFARGRLASMTDPSGSTSYSYERRGALLQEVRTIGSQEYATMYQYDHDGNRSSISYPSGRIVNYTFDFADRPQTAASDGSNLVSSASYLPFGPLTQLVMGNGTTKAMTYDNRYRVRQNTLTFASGLIADYHYAEDAAGNITQIHDAVDSSFNRDFGYDDLNRLTTATGGSSLWGTGGYTYDAMGNMLTSTLGTTVQTFTYTGTTPKLASVTYDAAGNELSGPLSPVETYTPRNLRDGFSYDGRGVRVLFTQAGFHGSPTVQTRVLYTPELRLLAAVSADAEPGIVETWGNTRSREIIWFGDLPVAQADQSLPGEIIGLEEPPPPIVHYTFTVLITSVLRCFRPMRRET